MKDKKRKQKEEEIPEDEEASPKGFSRTAVDREEERPSERHRNERGSNDKPNSVKGKRDGKRKRKENYDVICDHDIRYEESERPRKKKQEKRRKDARKEEDSVTKGTEKARKKRRDANGVADENGTFSGSPNDLGSGGFMKKTKLEERKSKERLVDERTSAEKQDKTMEISDESSDGLRHSSITGEGTKLRQDKSKRKRESDEAREEDHSERKKKKTNRKQETYGAENSPGSKKKSKKRVSFSNNVEVFSFDKARSSDGGCSEFGEGLVMGKRYSAAEDSMIRQAISDYIEQHDLGDDGLEKVLNCKKYPEVRNCWTEIAARLPWRPYKSIYIRAHVLYQRADERKWTDEERVAVLRFVAVHGRKWKKLGDELGKHRFHVKDLWRRIKLSSYKKGPWSQQEYQQLFDMVNLDLQHKAFEEKKTKYGMLRDNISWEAISDKLTTRNQTTCCLKWYNQLASPLVKAGSWANVDDHRLLARLLELDAHNADDVDWDSLLDNRPGELCRKRWLQMAKHIGENRVKPFPEQVHLLASRYCSRLLE